MLVNSAGERQVSEAFGTTFEAAQFSLTFTSADTPSEPASPAPDQGELGRGVGGVARLAAGHG